MDIVDKRILFYFLKDGRVSQRKIASLLNLTPASLNYRYKKLVDSGILKGFKLYVNPNFFGKYQYFIAFKNYKDIDAEWISVKIRCLEWLNVYGIQFSERSELKDKISYMTKELGQPEMTYYPLQSLFKPSNLVRKIVEILKNEPRKPSSKIALEIGVSRRSVERHIRYLRHKGLIMVIPEIDLGKADIVIFAIFSKNADEVSLALQECRIWHFTDGYAGITFCYADNIESAKKFINNARQFDKNADVMIVHEYAFR